MSTVGVHRAAVNYTLLVFAEHPEIKIVACCLFSPLTQLSVVGWEVTVLSMNKIQEHDELRAPNRWVTQFVFFYKNRANF